MITLLPTVLKLMAAVSATDKANARLTAPFRPPQAITIISLMLIE